MPFFGKKKKQKAPRPVIRFVDLSRRRDSDGESHSSSQPGDSLASGCHSQDCGQDKNDPPCSSRCSQLLDQQHQQHQLQHEEPEYLECLRRLDRLGVALENTFKEVDYVDAYMRRLRNEFDHEKLTEKRFMACFCSARIARVACCRLQVTAWRRLQQGIVEFCQYHHHELVEHHHLNNVPTHRCLKHQRQHERSSDVSSHSSHEEELDLLMEELHTLPSFSVVKQRLDPGASPRSFVEQWVIHSALSNHSIHSIHNALSNHSIRSQHTTPSSQPCRNKHTISASQCSGNQQNGLARPCSNSPTNPTHRQPSQKQLVPSTSPSSHSQLNHCQSQPGCDRHKAHYQSIGDPGQSNPSESQLSSPLNQPDISCIQPTATSRHLEVKNCVQRVDATIHGRLASSSAHTKVREIVECTRL